MLNAVSKHSQDAYEGKMCRLIFSRIMEGIYERILEEIPYEPEEGAKDTKSLDYSTRRWVTGMLNQLAEYVANEYNRILEEEDDKEWFWGEEEKK